MKLDLQNLSLRKQTIAIFMGLIILALINFFTIFSLQNKNYDVAKEVMAAKELQLLPSQIASHSQLYVNGDISAKGKLEAFTNEFDELLLKLTSEETGEDSLDISKGPYEKLAEKWEAIKLNLDIILFEPLKKDTVVSESREIPLYDSLNTITTEVTQKVLSVNNPALERANSYIQFSAADLSKAARRVLSKKSKKLKNLTATVNYVSLGFLLLFIAAVIGALKWSHDKISAPMKDLYDVAKQIGNGDLTKTSSYKLQNEIGKVAREINHISQNLQNATAFVNAIENGKLDVEFEGLDSVDLKNRGLEGALLTMRDQMKRVEEEERERKWSTEGLAKFVDILRTSDDDVTSLGDAVISNLVTYTNSNQGGIFIVDENEEGNKILELISLYAFDTHKYDKRYYRPGEGLVGQTYLERKTIYMLEVPQEYIRITSGLGMANPTAVLLVPLIINEEIYGVIELASFHEYKDYQIEFVEKLAESIASTISDVKNNERTKILLEESQELTEQMQAQEEEMRQNMEELSATQEEMSRKEVEMNAQLTAINNSLASAEYSMNGSLITANNNYISLLGYHHLEDIQERSFNALSADNTTELWQELRAGVSKSGIYKKMKKDGEPITVNTTYTPVKNNSGEFHKVIELILTVAEDNSSQSYGEDFEHLKEVEDTLRQNLEELEITQEQLDKKLRLTEATLDTLDNVVKIVIFNTEGSIVNINYAAQETLAVDASDITGQSVSTITIEELSEIKNKKVVTLKTNSDKDSVTANVHSDNTGERHYLIWI